MKYTKYVRLHRKPKHDIAMIVWSCYGYTIDLVTYYRQCLNLGMGVRPMFPLNILIVNFNQESKNPKKVFNKRLFS